MKNLLIDYNAESVRWMGYHAALKRFFEDTANLPNVPDDKNVRVIYATPSSAFTKHVIPLINGQTQRPIISFYLSSEETVQDVAGTPFLINKFYNTDEKGNATKISFSRPLMKSLTYTCNIFTTKMSDCDYLLTLLELRCNKFKPFSCKVNGRPTQFYLDDVETTTPTDYEGKKFISSTFKVSTPLASIFPAEIETDAAVIKNIYSYLTNESVSIPDKTERDEYIVVPESAFPVADASKCYELVDGKYVLTEDLILNPEKTYYYKLK